MPTPVPSTRRSSLGAPHRVRGLLEAHRLINSDLALDAVLSRIVRTACDLVDSPYGALGVVGPDGSLQDFIHHEVDEAPLPDIVPARPLRSVSDLPRVDHGATSTLYSVPIRGRDETFGTLYLARPLVGDFSAEDEELLAALAATAATAIANARLYEDAERSRDWLQASGEIARALLADSSGLGLLGDVAVRAQQVANADYCALLLPTDDGMLRVTVPSGLGALHFDGLIFHPANSPLGRSIVAGQSLLMADMTAASSPAYPNPFNFGPLMMTPLVDAKGVRGAIILLRVAGRAQFAPRDLDLATTFADQLALALELNEARGDAEALQVLEVRHRIAQDMHDNLIQRLFATGMGLQVLAERCEGQDEDLARRLHRYIDELDETIDQVRERVFGLREVPGTPAPRRPLGPSHVAPAPDRTA